MTNITWGPEIAVNGVKPEFIADDDVCAVFSCDMIWCGLENVLPARAYIWDQKITAIRLPADHWAYPVIEKGFWPWAGGDRAPEDWDGGEVLLRDKRVIRVSFHDMQLDGWRHIPADQYSDIIGYRRRPDAPVQASEPDTVTLKRMTRDEWTGLIIRHGDVGIAQHLGLIRDETPLERFARETSTEITDNNRAVIEAALKWGRESV